MRPGTLIRWAALRPILARQIRDGDILLDIGGFDGKLALFVKNNCSDVLINVLDTDIKGLAIAKAEGLNAIAGLAENLPVASETIDVVLCLDIIEHLDDEIPFLKEVFRIMKIEGRMILSTPKKTGIIFPFMKQADIERINYQWGHKRLGYSLGEIEAILGNHGFIIKKTDVYFNIITRFFYRILLMTKKTLPCFFWVFSKIVLLEPYIRKGAQEHILLIEKS